MGSNRQEIKQWVETLPHSKMVFPHTVDEQVRYLIWRICAPLHPFIRDFLLRIGILSHEGRQDYVLGRLAPEQSLKDFVNHLVTRGYGNHFIAWQDEGELVGLRLVKSFTHQYHLRIFEDGEIRGHYEYTPECYPFKHVRQVGMEHRRDDFMKLLDGWVTTQPQ